MKLSGKLGFIKEKALLSVINIVSYPT